MESEDEDYEFDVDPAVPFEHDRTVGYRTNRTTSPPSSELGDDSDNPIEQPLSPPLFQAMDIPSVRRPPVSVMVPADRVSTFPSEPYPRRVSLDSRKGEVSQGYPTSNHE